MGLLTIGDVALIFMENLGDAGAVEQSPRILGRVLQQKVGEIMKSRDLVDLKPRDPGRGSAQADVKVPLSQLSGA